MEAIETFFRDFEKYTNQNDADRLTSLYADTFMTADPSGARFVQATDLRAFIPKRKQLFATLGYRSTTLVSVHQTKLDDRYVLVRTEWVLHFDRDQIALPSTYIVQVSGEVLKIVFYLNHENIMTVLRDRGLLPAEKP
jgi:hypothetical protein